MSVAQAHLILARIEPEPWTLEGLVARTGGHPALCESCVEYGLLEPTARTGTPGHSTLEPSVSVQA